MGRRSGDPDQFDLFEPPHEWREDGRGTYLQFLIAPPTELSAQADPSASVELPAAASSEGPRAAFTASHAKGARD